MTVDEAIQRFERQLTDARVVLDNGFGTHEGECDTVYRHSKEMAEIALDTLHRTAEDDKAREEGRLVVLPCARNGAELYFADVFRGEIYKEAYTAGLGLFWTNDSDIGDYIPLSCIGKTVFLTRTEAEAALKGAVTHETD